jgi:hypothetical protein
VLIDTRALSRSSTRGLVAAIGIAAAISVLPGYLTFDYIQDRLILADRGVRVDAWVVDYQLSSRGSDRVTVAPVDPPRFEAALDHWPRGHYRGDLLDVVFDPRDPGRIAAVEEPLIDGGILAVAIFDLLCLFLLLFCMYVAGGELVRRGSARLRGDPSPDNDRLLQQRPPLRLRPRVPAGREILAGWETAQIVLVLVIAPVASSVIFGLVAADSLRDADALRTSGAHARGIVEESSWDSGGGWLDVRFPLPDGTEENASFINPLKKVYYEGDSVEVVYEPAAPSNAQPAGETGWAPLAWIFAGLFIVFMATAATTVAVAIITFIRRARAV